MFGMGFIEISDLMSEDAYTSQLKSVDGLEEIAREHLQLEDERAYPGVMEFILEGLYQSSFVAKETRERSTFYSDMLMRMFDGLGQE